MILLWIICSRTQILTLHQSSCRHFFHPRTFSVADVRLSHKMLHFLIPSCSLFHCAKTVSNTASLYFSLTVASFSSFSLVIAYLFLSSLPFFFCGTCSCSLTLKNLWSVQQFANRRTPTSKQPLLSLLHQYIIITMPLLTTWMLLCIFVNGTFLEGVLYC